MNSAHRISRRRTLLVLAGAATAAAAPPLSTVCVADTSLQHAAANDSRVPAAVRRIIVEQLEVEEHQVKWEARFVDDLGADSLDVVELIMALEEEFKIEIPDEEAERLRLVGDLVEYLRKREVLK